MDCDIQKIWNRIQESRMQPEFYTLLCIYYEVVSMVFFYCLQLLLDMLYCNKFCHIFFLSFLIATPPFPFQSKHLILNQNIYSGNDLVFWGWWCNDGKLVVASIYSSFKIVLHVGYFPPSFPAPLILFTKLFYH